MSQIERRQLNSEDLVLLMALKAEAEGHEAAIHALRHSHDLLLTNLQLRYNTPTGDGWVMQDYGIGFVRIVEGEGIETNGEPND